MLKKVLLFSNYHFDNYQGGPSGFINQNILGHEIDNLITLQILQQKSSTSRFREICKKIAKKTSELILKNNNKIWLDSFIQNSGNEYKRLQCSQFRYVYFHDIFSLYGCLKYIPASQQIILQSHAPQLVSEEFRELGHNIESIVKIQEIEKRAFERANILIFPHDGARVIYDSIIDQQSNIFYILSASRAIINTSQLPLDNSINLLFIGRRNQIKGFDLLLESFKLLRSSRKDINLLVAGNGEKIDQEGVITLGHINPDNWIASVDYVINLNRNSYFDLSVMEVLSTGTPLIITLTGGHIFFKGKSNGIIELEKMEMEYLIKVLKNLRKLSIEERNEMTRNNQLLYFDNFTPRHYRSRLENFIKNLK